MNRPVSARLPEGRLHLQHGPIDLLIEAWGTPHEIEAAYARAEARFQDVLETLVAELPMLRAPLGEAYPLFRGPVARRMAAAVWPHRASFVTPMAAVAGAVADEMLEALVAGGALDKALVNDGGDIAFLLPPGASLRAAVAHDPQRPALDAGIAIGAASPVRGLATSGWRGRSQSLGIADAVTVLARSAAQADAAATLVANAVNVLHPTIRRARARALKEDSDLGERFVTIEVGVLPACAVAEALEAGLAAAAAMRAAGLIEGAYLALQGERRLLEPTQDCAVPALNSQAQSHQGRIR